MLCFPEYYTKFRCIADKCSDTCCRGWEIDIDDSTLAKYRSVGGNIGRRLAENITTENGTSHFILSNDERCPFLNKSNLCDIYLELGEESLCGICNDHPRFRSFFSDRTEIGVGLCCEAAAEIILTERQPIKIVCETPFPEDPLERALLQIREMIFMLCRNGDPFIALRKCCALAIEMQDMLADGDFSGINERYDHFSGYSFISEELSNSDIISVLYSLESISDEWNEMLAKLSNRFYRTDFTTDSELLRLAEYFIFRHFPEALSDGDIVSKAYFALFAVSAVKMFWGTYLYENGTLFLKAKINGAKLFSKGVEYSEENMLRAYQSL
ncbi:MAG: flagellin lysine-N-methylase [Oscillospiraceae bacterium]